MNDGSIRAVFVDTSVLCCLLRVPKYDDGHDAVTAEFRDHRDRGIEMLLPVTTVVETGNHIAHSTGDRYRTAQRFVEMLTAVASGTAPWIAHEIEWGSELLGRLVSGVDGENLASSLVRRVGTGDRLITTERADFCRRMNWPISTVGICSRDVHLADRT